MRYGLLTYKESNNLGDEIQSIAARQFLPEIDEFLDRDYLNSYKAQEQIKLILNGWFMSRPENWPPSDSIIPLFISFHLSHAKGSDRLLIDPKLKKYYDKHSPIGCRDLKTVRLLKSIGVNAYHSYCLTLTLPPRNVAKTSDILFVDPFYKLPETIRKKYIDQLVPDSQKENIVYIDQMNDKISDVNKRYEIAESMLDRYAGAKLVFTSRIHCALPCLALGTPVYFLDSGFYGSAMRDRFDGILDLMNVLDKRYFPFPDNPFKRRLSNIIDVSPFFNMKHKPDIDWDNPRANPRDISPIQDRLRKTVRKFIEGKT